MFIKLYTIVILVLKIFEKHQILKKEDIHVILEQFCLT